MANRRMFSKDIVRSDTFLDLPISSQALYFHLGMEADDRGYVNNPKSVIRSICASIGDLEQLANKKFVLIRDESLILIKGWRINNTIQPTRLVETKFIDDLKQLFFDENNSYTEKPTEKPTLSSCQQIVDDLSTQVSIGKVSIGKDSIGKYRNTHINSNIRVSCQSDENESEQANENVFITLTLNDKTEHPITKTIVEEMKSLYPKVDVEQEFRNMKGWLIANPTKRKTKSGIMRFVNSWLAKEQNKYITPQHQTFTNESLSAAEEQRLQETIELSKVDWLTR